MSARLKVALLVQRSVHPKVVQTADSSVFQKGSMMAPLKELLERWMVARWGFWRVMLMDPRTV